MRCTVVLEFSDGDGSNVRRVELFGFIDTQANRTRAISESRSSRAKRFFRTYNRSL